jgi:O-antigen/teichoic acid export membrane protein
MLGEQKYCALAGLVALAVNVALCVALIPSRGILGAAIATTTAFIVESAMIFLIARRRLGFHLFVFGGKRS